MKILKHQNNLTECFKQQEAVCQQANHRVTKVLRMDLSFSEMLLRDNPNLKVVHLFRDPRAVINSHMTTPWFPIKDGSKNPIEDDIKIMCKRMRYDIESAIYLVDKYPDRVTVVQYEDYIENTVDKMRSLYTFLGMKFSSEYEAFVNKISQIKADSNNKVIAFSYRTKMPWDTVQMVDTYCKDVIHSLGLKTFPSKEHLNSTMFDPITTSLPFALLSRHN